MASSGSPLFKLFSSSPDDDEDEDDVETIKPDSEGVGLYPASSLGLHRCRISMPSGTFDTASPSQSF
jgi:hypothetical protein